jgi:hypothetical protein
MPVATSIVMDVLSFAWRRAVTPGVGALGVSSIKPDDSGCEVDGSEEISSSLS